MNIRRIVGGAGALLIAATLTACGGGEGTSTTQAKSGDGSAPAATATATPKEKADGKFVPVYGEATTDENVQMAKDLKDGQWLETFSQLGNGILKLPIDVTVAAEECEEANAYYTPDEKKITICYELANDGFTRYAEQAESDEENQKHGVANLYDTFFHELGHAVIDIYDLPATGKEDDAADQLSAYLMTALDSEGDGQDLALQTVNYYFLAASDEDRATLPFYDEHSMSEQRAYNYMCYMYGSDTKFYEGFVGEEPGMLPKARAERCEDEYAKLVKAWDKLLDPHLKAA
ncbi:DUF4344 domain-containing metallopeptidase [Nonomuraea typhae]|uniref:DUF4344 domain-containing metallopeptidase n=1 Tax=Nonomuraea typhae TaxID=2603600 RepID=UPI0012FA0FA5|nr:DUF4344 domain-containing metallopeptidase [Nonomuraea typhae]